MGENDSKSLIFNVKIYVYLQNQATLKYWINIHTYVHVQSVFKKSQIKIPHFFHAPQKLFLLILLKNESQYEVKSLNKTHFKRINRKNFCGAGKKWGIFICDFFKKYGSYMYVYLILWIWIQMRDLVHFVLQWSF